jgi:hypothetical protein
MLLDVVLRNADDCVKLFVSLFQLQFLRKDDAQLTQAIILAFQHMFLVCPELQGFALKHQARKFKLSFH